MELTLYSVPAPGLCIRGENRFLGTVRTNMHKASLTTLSAGLEDRLNEKGVPLNVQIVDMQTLPEKEKYGEINFGGLELDKYRVGFPFSKAEDSIKDSDIVGINANFTHSRTIVRDFIKYARQKKHKVIIVVGGADATADPEYYLKNGVDVVVRGEGEITLQRIVEALFKGADLREIENISYVTNGRIKHNASFFLRDKFDVNLMSPPNLDIIDLSTCTDTGEGKPPYGLKGPFISVETSRGCTRACSFCATPITKGRYRFMRIDTIRKHFDYLRSRGVETLLFQEDNILSRIHRNRDGGYLFPEGREELLEMFRLAREMGFIWEFTNGLEFGLYEHNGKIDYELIEAMFWHQTEEGGIKGCYRATIPLENLTDRGPELFRKLKPLGKGKEVIKTLAQTGVNTLAFNLIIGRPQDDQCKLRLSYERCLEIKDIIEKIGCRNTLYFNIYTLSLLPGTLDFRRYKDLLAFDLERDPEVVTFYLGSLRTKHFSPLEITQARGTLAKKLNKDQLIHDFDANCYITDSKFERIFS